MPQTVVVLRTINALVFPAKCVVCGEAWNKHLPVMIERIGNKYADAQPTHIAVPVCKRCQPNFKSGRLPGGCTLLPLMGLVMIASQHLFHNMFLQRLFLYAMGLPLVFFIKRQIVKWRPLTVEVESFGPEFRITFQNDAYAKEFAEKNNCGDHNIHAVHTKPIQFHLFTLFALTITVGIEIPLILWLAKRAGPDPGEIFGLIVFAALPLITVGGIVESFIRESERQRRMH